MKKGGKGVAKTRARYAIRSGPKQFTAYLNGKPYFILVLDANLTTFSVLLM